MEYFQDKFFHSVWEANYGPDKVETNSPYCKYDSQTLQLFQSCLYIAGIYVRYVVSGHVWFSHLLCCQSAHSLQAVCQFVCHACIVGFTRSLCACSSVCCPGCQLHRQVVRP